MEDSENESDDPGGECPPVLLIGEAAALLGTSAAHLLELVEVGEVPCAAYRAELRFFRGTLLQVQSRWFGDGGPVGSGTSPVR